MVHRRASAAVVLLALAVYVLGLLSGHVDYDETNEATERLWNALFAVFFTVPFVGVAAASQRWPRWWLIPVVFAFFFLMPLGLDKLEQEWAWYPVGTEASDYGREGMDHITTSILAIMAFPAAVIAIVGVAVGKWRRSRYSSRPTALSASAGSS